MALIRAAIAAARAGSSYKLSDRERASYFRNKLRRALITARSLVVPGQYDEFIEHASQVIKIESARFRRQPIELDEMHLLEFTKPMPISREIEWSAARLAIGFQAVRDHVEAAATIAASIMKGEPAFAQETLDAYTKSHGESFHSISLGIALTQLMKGTDALKQFIEPYKNTNKGGLLPYLATVFAQRAEDGVSIAWFADYVRRRAKLQTQPGLRHYIEFKLIGDLPTSPTSLAHILAIEQNHHPVDVFETLLAVVQQLAIHTKDQQLLQSCRSALTKLSSLTDFRIHKLLRTLDNLVEPRPTQPSATEKLLRGEIRWAYREFVLHVRTNPIAVNSLVGMAVARSIAPRHAHSRNLGTRNFTTRITDGLSSALERNADGLTEFYDKVSQMMMALPIGRCLLSISRATKALDVEDFTRWLRHAALNTPDQGLLDALSTNLDKTSESESPAPSFVEFATMLQARTSETQSALHETARCYAMGFGLLRQSRTTEAESVLQDLLASSLRIISRHATVLVLLAYARNQTIGRAAKVISEAVAKHQADPELLPIEAVFEGVSWKELQPHSSDIALSNALYLYAQAVTSDKVHSNRCFALQRVLRHYDVARPSRLKERIDLSGDTESALFLGRACGITVLDMLPSIESSRQVFEERRDICALLVNLGFDDSGEYQKELVALSRAIVIQAGLQAFDGSRVHVDTDRLRSVLRRELAESFSRFVQLTQNNDGDIDTFDSLLRELNRRDGTPKHLLAIPKSEADELLLYMILTARERFLFNIPHGLDSYLSKRVRHGSIVGTMRAPAEKEGIATQVGSDGSYRPSPQWMDKLEKPQHRKEVASAFSSFARSLDAHLIRLKDVVLHVKSDSHLVGIFDAPLHGPNYHLIRSVAIRDKSLETFIDTIFSALWGLLNPSLQRARDELKIVFVEFLARHVEALRANIAGIGLPSTVRAEIDAAVGRMSTNLQATALSVSGWFDPVAPEEHDFLLTDTVNIALAAVQSISPEFLPALTADCAEDLVISVTNLPVVVDVLFVAFQNVAKWAGLTDPVVTVTIRLDVSQEMLHIKVVNQTSPRDADLLNAKLATKRASLERNTTSKAVRSEGDSGLAKIASVVFQATAGLLDFKYVDGQTFCLEMALSIIPGSSESTR